MRKFLFFATLLFFGYSAKPQVNQVTIGASKISLVFNSVKYDPNDGGTVSVGYINDAATGNGNDCFITKMNADHQLVWQKIIPNPGDDRLNKVSICANGDYIVAGKIFTNGVLRGLVCRINSGNGNIIWSTSSSLIQTPAGEEFFDLTETINHNIVVVGYTNFTPPNTRGIIVLLNSAGQEIYTRISNYVENSTGFRTVIQLPDNNLLISGLYYINGSYTAVILEMNELNAALVSQNTYNINASITGINTNINSLQSATCNLLPDGNIYFQISAYTGAGTGPIVQGVYEYNQTTKNLAGNIYYHNTTNPAIAFAFYPVSFGDLLISQSFSNNGQNSEYVSRITNGAVAYDRKINGNISVSGMDINSNRLSLCGEYNNGTDMDAYALFSADVNIPTSSGQCKITNADSLKVIGSNLPATANATPLITDSSMSGFVISNPSTNYTATDLCAAVQCNTQILQTSIGSIGSTQVFTDVKFDPADGSTVHVGYINDAATGTGNDCFITKMNADHQLVWQKIIPKPGDDQLNKVSICANGDYIVAGKIFTNGVLRGLVCRINSGNGNIIWSTSSSLIQTPAGEEFFDLTETINHNIVVVGYTNFTPPNTRGIIVLLNSAGQEIYTRISNYVENSTGFRTVIQLPDNNLLISGLYYINGSYTSVILEMNELNAVLVSQNTYTINASIAGINTNINSLQSATCNLLPDGNIYFQISAYTGAGTGPVVQGIYEYNQTTKSLAGNIYYHNTINVPIAFAFYPIGFGDLLISQSFSNNGQNSEYVSRITNGAVAYDRKINGNISVSGMDINSNGLSLCGTYNNGTDMDAYTLFSADPNITASTCPCIITDENTVSFVTSNLSATSNASSLLIGTSMTNFVASDFNSIYSATDICGSVLPISLIKFTGFYNSAKNNTLLQWSTANEFNSKIFSVEKSVDGGKTFVAFGSVMANGSGNSVIQYNFTDLNPIVGVNFYRLKQIDIDEKFKYSNIISIVVPVRKSTNRFSLYPNPATGFTYINTTISENKKIEIELIDAAGKLLGKTSDNIDSAHPIKLEFPGISTGVYFVKILSDNSVQTDRVLIN